jgi:hypothetical protein
MYADEPWCHENFSIEVFPTVHRLADWHLGSDAEWETLTYFRNLFFHSGAAEGDDDGEEAVEEVVAAKSWASDPRMVNFWAYQESPGAVVLDDEARRQSSAQEEGEDDDVDLLTAAALEESRLHEFWAKRDELVARDTAVEDEAFYVHVRGGRFTLRTTGEAMDTVRASARAGVATEFVQQFGLQRTSSYALRAYGDEVAEALARCWADKLRWLLASWVEAGQPEAAGFELAAAAAAWEEPAWAQVVAQSGHRGAQQRLADIRRIGL